MYPFDRVGKKRVNEVIKKRCKIIAYNQRWAHTTTLRALNIFSETLYEEWSYNCVQTWYCTVHFSVQVLIWYKNWILHSQTIYKITGKVMPFYNNCFKIQIKTFRIKYLLFFIFHAPFHSPNLFSTWNRVSENIGNALNVVNFSHLCIQCMPTGMPTCGMHGSGLA